MGAGGVTIDPYGAGTWDLVFTADDPLSRPDPFRGDLLFNPSAANLGLITTYGLIPLNRDAVTASYPAAGPIAGGNQIGAPNGGDVTLIPLSPSATNPAYAAAGARAREIRW